jgi:uncharacterized protein YfaS (alpha-2-macroglobulin family)
MRNAAGVAWRGVRGMGRITGRVLAAVLGVWTAPAWLRWCGRQAGRGFAALAATVRAWPRASAALLATLVVAAGSGYGGYLWWQAQPKPEEASFEVSGPAVTDYANSGSPQPVTVTFDRSVAPLAQVGKEVTAGIEWLPRAEGQWQWMGDNRLVFTPRQDWPVGTSYRVTLLPTLVAPHVHLKSDEFRFSSAPFQAAIRKSEFHQDPLDPVRKKAVVELGFSHPVNAAELEKRIGLRLPGAAEERVPYTISYDKLKLTAYVHSAALPIPKESSQLVTRVEAGVTAQVGGPGSAEPLTQGVRVPGLYSLAVSNATVQVASNERYEAEQVLLVNTSQLVHERDLAQNLAAWVLPLHKPGTPPDEQRADQPYAWADLREITADVLAKSQKLPLSPVAAEREHTQVHSFRMQADVGRVLYLQVEPNIKSFGGYLMRRRSQHVVQVPPYPPELRLLGQGALLPLSGEKKLGVMVRDLPGIKFDIARVQPGQLQHLVSQSRGQFANPAFLGRINADHLSDRFERVVPLPGLQRGRPHYESLDLSRYLAGKEGEARRGLFLVRVQSHDEEAEQRRKAAEAAQPPQEEPQPGGGDEEPQEEEEHHEEHEQADPHVPHMEDRRLVLVTDLGLLVKQASDGSRDVFVQSIFTGLPVPGATVEIVAINGTALFSQATDANGRAHFEPLAGLARERAPLLVQARKGGDLSFLPLNRDDRFLDQSRFDVGGVVNPRSQDQLSAYLFSDRGIYRPGETVRIGAIVKSADWARSLAGVPLQAEVLDARALVVRRETLTLGAGGFAELAHATQETAPTGAYMVNLHVLKDGKAERLLGSTTVKVQEFLPDRMAVTATLSQPPADGWIHPKDLKGRVQALNLFGTPAENRRVQASVSLHPAWPAFRAWPDHAFYDPQRAKQGYTDELPEAQTDASGQAELDLRLARYERATYQLGFFAQVFEPEGGRHVAAQVSALVSELPFLVGVKHDGELGHVSRGSTRFSELIAIDPQARRIAAGKLGLQRVERKVVSVLMRQPNDTYRYESRRKDTVISDEALDVAAGGHRLKLDTRQAGDFSYVVRDAAGLELNRIDYSVAGEGNVTRSLERNAELQLTLDKKDYAPGDEIEVGIRAPYVGAGLITIERERVFAQQWFRTTTTASVQKIRLPADFEGNGYVTVQFIRDPGSDEVFMSPLSHGVVPFATSLGKRTNPLKLAVPALTRPGEAMKIQLSAARPTRAVVFAVDEGILQVAQYGGADPLGHFFQKRALEVRSSQILDLILPEFKRLMAAAAPGGDEAAANARFLNPFKRKSEAPAVYWSGIVDVDGSREFSYTVPDHFNGTLRVMAVAVSDQAIGVAQHKALVRGDFVLSPNLPLMVSPGDVFDLSVGVANNVADAPADAPVQLLVKPAAVFEVVGPAQQTLAVGPMREAVATYRLRVKDAQAAVPGSATVEFSAAWQGKGAVRRMDISVRPATPLATTVALGSFSGSTEVATPRDLIAEFRRQEVALSVLPLALAPGLVAYLDQFPHQCTEQLTSRALPALVLLRRPELSPGRTPAQLTQALRQAVGVLRTRQNGEGGFGLWTASVQADEFASVHATQLLLELREQEGLAGLVPQDMWQAALDHLQHLAASDPADLPAARRRAQAIYLLTRNGAVTTSLVASLRETLAARHAQAWPTDAAAAYLAATYQLLKQDAPAEALMAPLAAQLEKGGKPYRYQYFDDPTIRDAQVLHLLARHFPARLKALPPAAVARFVGPLGQGEFNTLSSAYTILAFDAMARTLGADALGKLSVAQLDAQGRSTPVALPDSLLPRAEFAPGTRRLKLGSEGSVPVYYAVTQTGFDRSPPTDELKTGLEVVREYLGADGKPATRVKVGDELVVNLSLRAVDALGGVSFVPSVALTDLLPGGFEPVQSRGSDGAPTTVGGADLQFADVREDRVVVYADAGSSVQTYSYRIRATNVGEFTVPPAFAQAMYERRVQARSRAGRITVDK